ncbi:MAG: NADH-quinone oxidoreductase subunit L, partial [Bacteroidetes bacterium]|nr:NADH-quinone oxidoreductase subunit L [Bacteroidota bacterium]
MTHSTYIALIPLLPLAGFILLGLFGRSFFKNSSGLIGTVLLLSSFALALYTAYDYFFVVGRTNGVYEKIVPFQLTWLQFSEGFSIDLGVILDPISVMMILVVTLISL